MNLNNFSDVPLIDQEQLDMLIETGESASAELIDELLGLFVGETEPKLVELKSDIRAASHGDIARHAHAIAGSSANLGALRLSEVARGLERSAATLKVAEAEEVLAYLKNCYRESVTLFQGQIDRLRQG